MMMRFIDPRYRKLLISVLAGSIGAVSPVIGNEATILPASDPENQGGWILRADISDEFDGTTLDRSKWFVQGENEQYYIWKGRAPSQFAAHNVRVEDGKLKLRSQWEPDFDFAEAEGHEGNTYATHDGQRIPVTTAGVITKKRFLHGYMEAKTKAGNATMTSSFWAIGYHSELDIYEQMGRPKLPGDIHDDTFKCSVHDWAPPAMRPTRKFGHKQRLPFRVADQFHVYGCEWGADYLKCFVDGKLVYETTQAEVGRDWVLTNPLEIWFDSEVFVWLGLPDAAQLPADYEIEYLRVWQQPQSNLLDRACFGFEGPMLFQQRPRPLELVPVSSRNNDYQKFWHLEPAARQYLSIVKNEHASAGQKSLRFLHEDEARVTSARAESPPGSIDLPPGDYTLTLNVWIKPHCHVQQLRVGTVDPATELAAFDLEDVAQGTWVTLQQGFEQQLPSGSKHRMTLEVEDGDASQSSNLLYIDEIAIELR